MIKMSQLVGQVVKDHTSIILIIKVGDSYYPATDENADLFETYLHTGDELYLQGLTNELEA